MHKPIDFSFVQMQLLVCNKAMLYASIPNTTPTCLSSNVRTWHVDKVWMASVLGVSVLQLPLFSPPFPGWRTPAGTHLIIHPVRLSRSEWHSDQFRLTTCEVLRRVFFWPLRENVASVCAHLDYKLEASQPALVATTQTRATCNSLGEVNELIFCGRMNKLYSNDANAIICQVILTVWEGAQL